MQKANRMIRAGLVTMLAQMKLRKPLPAEASNLMSNDSGRIAPIFRSDVERLLSVLGNGLTVFDYEEVLDDHRRLVRELDVLLNGQAGAAPQASLCDVVAQVQRAPIQWVMCDGASLVHRTYATEEQAADACRWYNFYMPNRPYTYKRCLLLP